MYPIRVLGGTESEGNLTNDLDLPSCYYDIAA